MARRRVSPLASIYATILIFLIWQTIKVTCQVLTPPYFNLAKSRRITATSTCGLGVAEPELFCRLTGATSLRISPDIIKGQACDFCDQSNPNQFHPPEYAIDGTERWWQSPPLSRSLDFNHVNVTIDLGQEFHVAYIYIRMANSPRPGVWVLERSTDFGRTWSAWQYFADTSNDCMKFFNTPATASTDEIPRDDSVICTTEFSNVVPLVNGEVIVSLVHKRPNAANFSNSETLQNWTKATNVRLNLIRTKTLLGHLMALARQDSTVTRRYYYAIRDISVGGRCVCNGHAETCDRTDPNDVSNRLLCNCQHNTCGPQCEVCCPGFVQKQWQRPNHYKHFECEPCNCHGHSSECEYQAQVDRDKLSMDIYGRYSGGGVCLNCQHNTAGINCEKCASGYFRRLDRLSNDTDVCQKCACNRPEFTGECESETGRCLCAVAYTGLYCDSCSVGYYGYPNCLPCDCNVNGTEDRLCTVDGGQCPCKANYGGRNCDMCALGYYDFPRCVECGCKAIGSRRKACDLDSGQCECEGNYGGRDCSVCASGFYGYPKCEFCDCEASGAVAAVCQKDTGYCLCKDNFSGLRCDRCAPTFYNYPLCSECNCTSPGSTTPSCADDGQCRCHPNFGGRRCGQCAPGYYKYPTCSPCNCDLYGSLGVSCDNSTGACSCRAHFTGPTCGKCLDGYYNYPMCEECNCNPAGAKDVPGLPLGGCGLMNKGRLCECKDRVAGRTCDTCQAGFWNLNINNPQGCEECQCNVAGTIGSSTICDVQSGQCACKVTVTGQKCNRCRPGFYKLELHNIYGCQDCACDVGGAAHARCDPVTGKCVCKPRITGRACNQPIASHYFPTLHQEKYEMEEGQTNRGTPARYDFNRDIFPGFSWKGYVVLSPVQPEVLLDVEFTKPSLYRLIYRYVNRQGNSVRGDVTFIPRSSAGSQQKSSVAFAPSLDPSFAMATDNGIPSTFVLNPGKWTISIKTDETVYLDYLVLLPQAYYEATVLKERVTRPCTVPNDAGPCIHYQYPNVTSFNSVLGSDGYIARNQTRVRTQMLDDSDIIEEYGVTGLGLLNEKQKSFFMDLIIPRPGEYVLLAEYYNAESGRDQELIIDVAARKWRQQGRLSLDYCVYSSLCRQVVTNEAGGPAVFNITSGYISVTVTGKDDVNLAIASITAIPYNRWSVGYLHPAIVCIRINEKCVRSAYLKPTGSVRIDFEVSNSHLVADVPKGYLGDAKQLIKLLPKATVNVTGRARLSSQYVLVTHYHQSSATEFDVEIIMNVGGQTFEGVFKPGYCSNVDGCRGVVHFEADEVISLKDTNFTLTLNNTSEYPLWLDYYLLIPAAQYLPAFLELQPINKADQFISECIDENFNIVPPVSEFCRSGLFSLTSNSNNGALQCACNVDGSLSLQCEPFGGQCRCRDNIIGRDCSQCSTGYYGFPRCRACSCPYGLCHPVTGNCICPPRVIGDRCDSCQSETFGFDPIIGCEECKCNPQGVLGGDLNCNPVNGACKCLPNIGGRQCDTCLVGYHSLPRCDACDCQTDGTLEDVCDQNTAQCLCKSNTLEPRCDACKPESFFLERKNPAGCTECFCFGTTSRCTSSTLRRHKVSDMKKWSVSNVRTSDVIEAGTTIAFRVEDKVVNNSTAIYWIAPASYTGNMLSAYGGKLNYTVVFMLPRDNNKDNRGLIQPDIILKGQNVTLVHSVPQQPQNGRPMTIALDLLEYNFEYAESGDAVTRGQFMMVLVKLEAIHIRASYYTRVDEIRLSHVSLDAASVNGTGDVASNVEQCACPSNYVGSSCEECAIGYYRSMTGPYLGVCVPCQCHGHADACDRVTGECLGCRDNTEGPYCEKCLKGHFGDPTRGSCITCSCPLPTALNNFADSCEVDEFNEVFLCHCRPGYTGRFCNKCAAGYWGVPNVVGGECGRCGCSGNINLNDPQSCHAETGACLLCANNTAGTQCDMCREWFYGDAVMKKDCQACSCNQCGTQYCDNLSGACVCKDNVIGDNCDQCAPDHYGFDYCSGCEYCGCGVGAVSTQCDGRTGACQCQPGVTGRLCDTCLHGYWRLTPSGCEACTCMTEGAVTCDALTGRCECLPGVTGVNCDQCHPRWVLVPDQGCTECDSCVNLLLDDLDRLQYTLANSQTELTNLTVSLLAFQRLARIEEQVMMLRAELGKAGQGLDAASVSLLQRRVDQLKPALTDMKSRVTDLFDLANTTENQLPSPSDIQGRDYNVSMADQDARDAVEFVKGVLRTIQGKIQIINIEKYINDARRFLSTILDVDFSVQNDTCHGEVAAAEEALARARALRFQVDGLFNRSSALFASINDGLEKRLNDLKNNSAKSQRTSSDVEFIVAKYPIPLKVKDDIEVLNTELAAVKALLGVGRDLNLEASSGLNDMENILSAIGKNYSQLVDAIGKLEAYIIGLQEYVNVSEPVVQDARDHADGLEKQASDLQKIYLNTKNSSVSALQAALAYQKIVDAIDSAMNASQRALDDSLDAFTKSEGVGANSLDSKAKSTNLSANASQTYMTTQDELGGQLRRAKAATKEVMGLVDSYGTTIGTLKDSVATLSNAGLAEQANKVIDKTRDAKAISEGTLEKVQGILVNLPEDQSKIEGIPDHLRSTRRDIGIMQSNVEGLSKLIPDTRTLLSTMNTRVESMKLIINNLKANITQLRDKIAMAQYEANKINVGMSMQGDTAVSLRVPDSVHHETGSYTKLSFYIRPTQLDAFLVYMGPDQKHGRKQPDDYLSLELKTGQVVFKYDLGSGPAVITSDMTLKTGNWYKIEAERIGKAGKLRVSTEVGAKGDAKVEQSSEVKGMSPGTHTVLKLVPGLASVIVGGVPPGYNMPSDVIQIGFYGNMEELQVAKTPLGLWNFESYSGSMDGAKEKDIFTKVEGVSGYRFTGRGYVIINKKNWNYRRVSNIKFQMKTSSSDGLIMFMSKVSGDFMSLEMIGGYVVYKYNLGGGRAVITSNKKYNDGKNHTVVASRIRQDGILTIDSTDVSKGRSKGTLSDLSINKEIYIGGYPGLLLPQEGVNAYPFHGCIDGVNLGLIRVNLVTQNIGAKDVIAGCVDSMDRVISFSKSLTGYAAYTTPDDKFIPIGKDFDISFKMKTQLNTTVLVYTRSKYKRGEKVADEFIVYIQEGAIGMKIQSGRSYVNIISQGNSYHDGVWHYISVMKKGGKFMLNIDDMDSTLQSFNNARDGIDIGTPIYFGGIPTDLVDKRPDGYFPPPLVGCIGDVAIGGVFVNFATIKPYRLVRAAFGACPIKDPADVHPTASIPRILTNRTQIIDMGTCALPIKPSLTPPVTKAMGQRFGRAADSRQEYDKLPVDFRRRGIFTLEFRTTAPHGIMFYMADPKHKDFIALYMVDGFVQAAFDCGTGAVRLTSPKVDNDGKWHQVKFVKDGRNGHLEVDGMLVQSGLSPGTATSIGYRSPLYVGGISNDVRKKAQGNVGRQGALGFVGCLKNLRLNGLEFSAPSNAIGVKDCFDNVEIGAFFQEPGDSIILDKNFKVGLDLTIQIEIRPRVMSGVLVSVHSPRGDFVLLQMVDGEVLFSADNGGGIITTKHEPFVSNELCDGNWHKIKAVKAKNTVTMEVDGQSAMAKSGKPGNSEANTNNHLIIGSIPEHGVQRGVATNDSYIGCVRNVFINNQFYYLTSAEFTGKVETDSCPNN